MRFSFPGVTTLAVLALCAPAWVRAADPQTYRVDIASTENGSMDDTLRATSELVSLRSAAPVSPFGLIARARGEVDRLKTVLESYGYYQSKVDITIDGMALNSATLADALAGLPKGTDAKVAVSFQLGPLYHLGKVSLEGTVPDSARSVFSLKPGAPAVAAEVLAAGGRVLSALQESGYAFAKVDPPVAYEDQTQPLLDVSFRVDAGKQVNIGEIRFQGLKRLKEPLVRRRLTLHTGQRYSGSAVENARRDLLKLTPIAAISVQVGSTADATGGVPVIFTITERLRHAVAVSSAFSTDLGGSAEVKWTDRNLFGNAEQLDVTASLINLGGSATTGIGYDTSVKLSLPDFGHRDQSLQFTVGAIKQSLQAYDQKAITAGVSLNRRLSSVWSASVGLSTAREQIIQEAVFYDAAVTQLPLSVPVEYNYTLVALPMSVNYDSTNLASPLDDPLHGMRNSLTVTPTHSLGHPSASFVISQIKLAAYFDLEKLGFTQPGRTVIATRVLAGLSQGAGEYSLPPDQRFYGGGSGTIRGYAYQAVGPKFATDGNPIGGNSIAAGSVELRQRYGKNLGFAVFADAGQVSASSKELPNEFSLGVGFGVRYYTGIGPIRLDIAVPTKRSRVNYSYATLDPKTGAAVPHGLTVEDDAFEIYIGLGQAF
jgi:translocation and assembly module TamA